MKYLLIVLLFVTEDTIKMGIGRSKYRLNNKKYSSYEELTKDLKNAGLEACQLIIGIDFTKSNLTQGGFPYYISENLHDIHYPNPYQSVLSIMCESLKDFDDDGLIPVYGFGDSHTTNKGVFSLNYDGQSREIPCSSFEQLVSAYSNVAIGINTGKVKPSGPTSFVPIIKKAIEIVSREKAFHILLIICDGAVDDIKESENAIIEASKYPLSIVCIGVGKGPWKSMRKFDNNIPKRKFDNFHFVDYHSLMDKCENNFIAFAKEVLTEVPMQYRYIKKYIMN